MAETKTTYDGRKMLYISKKYVELFKWIKENAIKNGKSESEFISSILKQYRDDQKSTP